MPLNNYASKKMQNVTDKYDIVIGIEVHAQLNTKTKLWCGCKIDRYALENEKVCEVCSGMPGSLPLLNKQAVNYAVKAALALNAKVNNFSYFDRKNYFYPDLPKGFQISQYDTPVALDGYLEVDCEHEDHLHKKKIGIERIQLEEDTGKSVHDKNYSLVNLNRAGTPLIEIVSRPEMNTIEQAVDYLKKLHAILRYIDVCKGNMQEGNFRADVNISLSEKGSGKFGTRTETKNLNSFRNVERALKYEINRQFELLESGQKVEQETLTFDVETGKCKTLRGKGDAHDYRYFPEPDLLPITVTQDQIASVKEKMPPLPRALYYKYVNDYKLTDYDATNLTDNKDIALFSLLLFSS